MTMRDVKCVTHNDEPTQTVKKFLNLEKMKRATVSDEKCLNYTEQNDLNQQSHLQFPSNNDDNAGICIFK